MSRFAIRNRKGEYLSQSMRLGVWTTNRLDFQFYYEKGTALACAAILGGEAVEY